MVLDFSTLSTGSAGAPKTALDGTPGNLCIGLEGAGPWIFRSSKSEDQLQNANSQDSPLGMPALVAFYVHPVLLGLITSSPLFHNDH